MCNFLSLVSTPETGGIYYFDLKTRKELNKSNPEGYEFDSHSTIAKFFGLNEDNCNKFEYEPLSENFVVDQINNKINDTEKVKAFVKVLIDSGDLKLLLDSGLYEFDYSKL